MNAHPEAEPGDARPRHEDASGQPGTEDVRAGGHLKEAIRREVVAVLAVLGRGRGNAIRGHLLAGAVSERLRDQGIQVLISKETMRRRIREAVVELIEAGEDIASASSPPFGYYIPEGEQEIRDGAKEIWGRVAALARRGRKYDRNTADKLLALLGQLGLLDAGRPA